LVSWGPGETRLALVDSDERVIELFLARPGMIAGSVVMGRIVGKVPGGNGLFVEIGQDRAGFMSNPPKTGAKRSEGQAVMVQVRSDAAHGKGATVAMDVSFSGAWLAYTPTKPGLALSRRLDDEERARLQGIVAPLLTEDEGVSIRTAAAGKSAAELTQELAHLRSQWQAVQRAKAQAKVPAVLWSPDPVDRMLALHPGIECIRVDDAALFAELKSRLGDRVVHDRGGLDEIIDEALEEATAIAIALPDGGRVSFGALAALTAIDVDSGKGAAQAANAQAAIEIARQIRLRGLGGQIVVDFIPTGGKGGLTNLAAQLRRFVSFDPINTAVLGITAMGLVEMTRERRGPSIPELCLIDETQSSSQAVALQALRQAVKEAHHRPGRPLTIVASPTVEAALYADRAALEQAQARIGLPLTVRAEPGRNRDDFLIEESRG
jgi:ribonuclease E/ribonuclease G